VTVAWRVCGVDEAGRGPLAGPVIAAAVILDPGNPVEGLADSKVLSVTRRAALAAMLREQALAWAVGRAEVEEIDRVNILRATMLAMRRAVLALASTPLEVLVDGDTLPELPMRARAIVGGDATTPCIAAASIIAKTTRDAEMRLLHERFPDYGFDQHKGYPTAAHLAALRRYGPSPIHRRTFRPVRALLAQGLAGGLSARAGID
jgi:ribonuclease HII